MKHVATAVLLLVIGGVVFFSLRRGLTSKSANPLVSTKTSRGDQKDVGGLKVVGNMLLTSGGKKITFHAVTSSAFRWPCKNCLPAQNIINRLEIIPQWGANAIQFYLYPDLFDLSGKERMDRMDDLKIVIDWGTERGLVFILNPVNDDPWQHNAWRPVRTANGIAVRDSMTSFLGRLAKEFGSHKNIVFGLETEPKYIENPQMLQDRIDAIRKESTAPILVPVTDYTGGFDIKAAMDTNQLKGDNFIMDYHWYAGRDEKDSGIADAMKSLSETNVFYLHDKYPTLVGEFGGYWGPDYNSSSSAMLTERIGDMVKAAGLGFSVYSLDDAFDEKGNLTVVGEVAKRLLRQ